jgi:hypothetical protein
MLYGIITAAHRIAISNDASLDARDFNAWDYDPLDFVALDAACARPPARAPDRPSTR